MVELTSFKNISNRIFKLIFYFTYLTLSHTFQSLSQKPEFYDFQYYRKPVNTQCKVIVQRLTTKRIYVDHVC